MANIISDFFLVTGIDQVPPSNMAELIPYLIQIFIGVSLVSCTFSIIGSILNLFFNTFRFTK